MLYITCLFSSAVMDGSSCQLPDAWRGTWFQSGLNTVRINETTIDFKGKCLESDGEYYLFEENKCHTTGGLISCVVFMSFSAGYTRLDATPLDCCVWQGELVPKRLILLLPSYYPLVRSHFLFAVSSDNQTCKQIIRR
ncbi:hypothetical protein OUZ56_028458 [Daphnia magna]|uniref:DUF7044 domain-containing protein n=1 Tax=Daphnia magna TaxID=35525 RepID=A0ABR0B3X7_9CRUS|nr:hypothetical protein OUZ56_028458 [Daphnia magna]